MTNSPNSFDFSELSVAERILLVQDLWDSIAAEPDAFPLTQDQEEELERRVAAADRGELRFSPWQEVKKRLFRHQ
ncbi:addiction module protein [soil metagenome]